jgi:hypothetical protein
MVLVDCFRRSSKLPITLTNVRKQGLTKKLLIEEKIGPSLEAGVIESGKSETIVL